MRFAVPTVRFLKNSDNMAECFAGISDLRALEDFGVLLQFVGDLIMMKLPHR